MAKLKIYNEIVDEQTKTILEGWFGLESTCFNDVKSFIDQIPEDDENLDIYLHCPGGSCIEGWAMYDALRTSGKKITTIVDGLCASMGTVLMMAAPKERRFAQKNASLCIHNPYYSDYFQYEETAHVEDLEAMANKVRIQAEELRETQDKILNLYVERTGTDKQTLEDLMKEDRIIGTDKALELGLIGDVLEPNTDKLNSIIKNMNTETVTVKASVLDRLLAKLGLKSLDELTPKNQVITDSTGAELTIDREEGEPQVGDKATPDGEFVMEDGSTITVAEGTITSIARKGEEENDNDENEDDDENEEDKMKRECELENLNSQIASLTTEKNDLLAKVKTDEEVAMLAKIPSLEEQIQNLTSENETLKASVKSDEDNAILAKVAELGGLNAIEDALKASSSFVAPKQDFDEHKHEDEAPKNDFSAFLADKRSTRKATVID